MLLTADILGNLKTPASFKIIKTPSWETYIHRANRNARCVRAVHTCHRDGPLAWLPIIDGDYAATVYAPRYLMFVFTCGDTTVAFNAALGIAKELHSCHECLPLRTFNVAERAPGLLH